MRLFACPDCGGPLHFDNLTCVCGASVVYDPQQAVFNHSGHYCANRDPIGCNWQAENPGQLCLSCGMTEVIPNTFHDENRGLWAEAEAAKRWVLANFARWGWFRAWDNGPKPVFHMLAEQGRAGTASVIMGHDDGLVTINVMEADPAQRAQRRQALGERLRTMIGHFRHELGHFFFFKRFAPQEGFTDSFRALFGDERRDYDEALEAHYGKGPPAGWAESHVTEYASSHPHEDWAESFAHMLHLTDISDSFAAAGLLSPSITWPGYDAYLQTDAEQLISTGVELGIALNHVNRSMGLQDLYPFVLTPTIREKLVFVHQWLRNPA